MTTGSFLDGGILTSSVQEQGLFYSASMMVREQTLVMGSFVLPFLTYPIGYSGSITQEPQETTPFPSGAIGVVVPTIGQVWPRGNR